MTCPEVEMSPPFLANFCVSRDCVGRICGMTLNESLLYPDEDSNDMYARRCLRRSPIINPYNPIYNVYPRPGRGYNYQSSSGGSRPVLLGSSSSSLLSSIFAFRNRLSISCCFFSCSDMTLAAGTNFLRASVLILGASDTDPSSASRPNV